MKIYRFWLHVVLLVGASGLVQAEPFRDDAGRLEMEDCGAAKAWRASAASVRDEDAYPLLQAAYACVGSGDLEEAKPLRSLADALRRDASDFGASDLMRVRIALALDEVDRAAILLRTTSETVLDDWSQVDDPLSLMHIAHAIQRLNDDVATSLRERDAARAVVHWLLAARAYDLPEVGAPAQAALDRSVALELAMEAKLAEPLIAASNAILDSSDGDLSPRMAAGVALAATVLVDQNRSDDALALARRLKATGQPDAVRNAENVIQHVERQR